MLFGYNLYLCMCDMVWFWEWIGNNIKVMLNWFYVYKCKFLCEWVIKFFLDFFLFYLYCYLLSFYVIVVILMVVGVVLIVIVVGLFYYYWWYIKYFFYFMWVRKCGYELLFGSDDDFIYDVFVVYYLDDWVWVILELILCLERKEKFWFCFYDRDFEVGKLIVDNIIEKINSSWKVLFLLFNNFI